VKMDGSSVEVKPRGTNLIASWQVSAAVLLPTPHVLLLLSWGLPLLLPLLRREGGNPIASVRWCKDAMGGASSG